MVQIQDVRHGVGDMVDEVLEVLGRLPGGDVTRYTEDLRHDPILKDRDGVDLVCRGLCARSPHTNLQAAHRLPMP